MVIYLLECIIPKIARNFKRCLRYNQKNYANAYNLGEKPKNIFLFLFSRFQTETDIY